MSDEELYKAMEFLTADATRQALRYREAMLVIPPTVEQERDYWKMKFLRMRQKRNNKTQTLRALRKRYEDLQRKYEQLGLWSMGAQGAEKP